MRITYVDGKKIRMSEEDYRTLLKRFDLKNARSGFDMTIINKICLCMKYCWGCMTESKKRCPLKKFEDKEHGAEGCHKVMEKVVVDFFKNYPHITFSAKRMMWENKHDKVARKFITEIREHLLNMKKGR